MNNENTSPDAVARPCWLSREWSMAILNMESVCFSEGIGPDISEILRWIARVYPDLKTKFSWLNWPE